MLRGGASDQEFYSNGDPFIEIKMPAERKFSPLTFEDFFFNLNSWTLVINPGSLRVQQTLCERGSAIYQFLLPSS